jgi:hypothetical protein
MQNFLFRFEIKLHFTVVSSKHMIQSETLVKKTHSKKQALRALVNYITFFRPQKERFVVRVLSANSLDRKQNGVQHKATVSRRVIRTP